MHQQSHGESFLSLAANRFGHDGLYLLDEPEAALSVPGELALLAVIARAVSVGAQFVVASHSPILLTCRMPASTSSTAPASRARTTTICRRSASRAASSPRRERYLRALDSDALEEDERSR